MLTRTYALVCDWCGKWSSSSGFASSKLARAHARREGWKRMRPKGDVPLRDVCSRCAKRQTE